MTQPKQNENADDRESFPWWVIVCVILIIVAVAFIVNELAGG